MSPEEIYARFIQEFPNLENRVLKYYDNSRHEPNSIKVWFKNHARLIFTVTNNGCDLKKA